MRALIVTCLLPLFAMNAYAQTTATAADASSESRVKMGEVLSNKKFRPDDRITDLELKAQSGSLSRYSLKFDLSYSGPPVDNLSDPQMPNPDNRPRPNRTSLGGFMGLRYRMSQSDALNLSTGLRWFAPYHQIAGEEVRKSRGEKDYEIANPALSYDRTYAVGATQMRSSLKGSYTTSDFYQERGQVASAGVSQSVKWVVLGSRWTVGSLLDYDYYHFDRKYRREDRRMSNYNVSLIPSLEFRILDNLNFRTSAAYLFSNLRMSDNWWGWDQSMISARAGFGWSITRDVFFSPYLQFFTDSPAIRTTSLSFSTVFSIF